MTRGHLDQIAYALGMAWEPCDATKWGADCVDGRMVERRPDPSSDSYQDICNVCGGAGEVLRKLEDLS